MTSLYTLRFTWNTSIGLLWYSTQPCCYFPPNVYSLYELTPKPGRKEAEDSPTPAREFEGYNIPSQAYSSYEDSDYRKDQRGPPPHDEPVAPGSLGYSKFDYDDPRGDGREGRGSYGGYPPRAEDDYHYPPRRYPPRPPPDPDLGYPHSAPRDYPGYPGGGRWAREDDERQRPPSPPPTRAPPRVYPYDRAPYPDPEAPIPRAVRPRPDDYRGPPPPHADPYDNRPMFPPEPKRGGGILSQMESIDYSHGGSGIKSVDYGHGTPGDPPVYPPREIPPRPLNYPSFGGPGSEYAGMYGEGIPYMGYGSPAVGVYAGGLDPAAIFAAYQGGE